MKNAKNMTKAAMKKTKGGCDTDKKKGVSYTDRDQVIYYSYQLKNVQVVS